MGGWEKTGSGAAVAGTLCAVQRFHRQVEQTDTNPPLFDLKASAHVCLRLCAHAGICVYSAPAYSSMMRFGSCAYVRSTTVRLGRLASDLSRPSGMRGDRRATLISF